MNNIIEALLRLILKVVFPELLDIALSVVSEIQNDPPVCRPDGTGREVLTDEEKRTRAFERIKEKLKQSEKDLPAPQASRQAGAKDSVINLAIELAVSYIKNLKG